MAGETLWALAGRYYEDPFLWLRIFEANRSQIENPNLILPDQEFVIPGIAADEVAVVERDEPAVAEAEVQEVISERDRRSVFFRDPLTTLSVRAVAADEYLIVSRVSV